MQFKLSSLHSLSTELFSLHCLFLREQLSSFIYLLVFTLLLYSHRCPPSSSLYLHRCLSLCCSWNGLHQEVWTEAQRGRVLRVCVGLCVNEIKWEWMCGPPRGLAAGAVYNHQATSPLFSCPLTYSFLPLPLRLNDFFSVVADKKALLNNAIIG